MTEPKSADKDEQVKLLPLLEEWVDSLQNALRWESHRMGAVSSANIESVILGMKKIYKELE